MDTTTKLEGYFKVASVQHYLIVDPGVAPSLTTSAEAVLS